ASSGGSDLLLWAARADNHEPLGTENWIRILKALKDEYPTQRALAEAVGLKETTVSEYLNGDPQARRLLENEERKKLRAAKAQNGASVAPSPSDGQPAPSVLRPPSPNGSMTPVREQGETPFTQPEIPSGGTGPAEKARQVSLKAETPRKTPSESGFGVETAVNPAHGSNGGTTGGRESASPPSQLGFHAIAPAPPLSLSTAESSEEKALRFVVEASGTLLGLEMYLSPLAFRNAPREALGRLAAQLRARAMTMLDMADDLEAGRFAKTPTPRPRAGLFRPSVQAPEIVLKPNGNGPQTVKIILEEGKRPVHVPLLAVMSSGVRVSIDGKEKFVSKKWVVS
ncbi:MAG: winged helix-turn-helix domain-containing protein, partial [Euryarchaeota archaeon]|nr:winged helix-turn-helix domain-containing protein [Euryarchaeota archaeon]